jgi:hypothetical protein
MMSETLTNEEAIAELPEWDWVRGLAIDDNRSAKELYLRRESVLEVVSHEFAQIVIAEAGSQRLGFGIRVEVPSDDTTRLYFETRQRTDEPLVGGQLRRDPVRHRHAARRRTPCLARD